MESWEINNLICNEVLEWKWNNDQKHWIDDLGNYHYDFSPSTRIDDAWLVLNHICELNNWRVVIDSDKNETQVNLKGKMGSDMQFLGHHSDACMAICMICLDTVGIALEE